MKFRTELPPPKYPFHIGYSDKLLFLGSCFSDHIGDFFHRYKFDALCNPFGTLFNPHSIATALNLSLHPELFTEQYLCPVNGEWMSFAHHGQFSHPDKNCFVTAIHQQLKETGDFLRQTDFLFLTFGTAYVYRHKKTGLIVANCHKIPACEFTKERLNIEEIVAMYLPLLKELKQINPSLQTIITISPVRHLSDGFHENQLSKSILHVATDKILISQSQTYYFPAYEIVNDDLRDYRFYAQDLCHPGENALMYLKEMVVAAFLNQETENQRLIVEKELKFSEHKPLKRKIR